MHYAPGCAAGFYTLPISRESNWYPLISDNLVNHAVMQQRDLQTPMRPERVALDTTVLKAPCVSYRAPRVAIVRPPPRESMVAHLSLQINLIYLTFITPNHLYLLTSYWMLLVAIISYHIHIHLLTGLVITNIRFILVLPLLELLETRPRMWWCWSQLPVSWGLLLLLMMTSTDLKMNDITSL